MAPTFQLQYSHDVDNVQRRGDTSRDSLLGWEKRQGSPSPSSRTSPNSVAQATTMASLSSSAQSAITPQLSPTTFSSASSSFLSLPTSFSTSQSLSSPNPTTPSYSNSDPAAPSSEDTRAVIFGIIGGILGLLLLGLIVFRLLRRYRQTRSQKHLHHGSFWEKWNWGTYSPVDEDTFPDADAQGKSSRNNGIPSYAWWQKFGFHAVSGARRVEGKKKKSRTLYKVRRSKPGEDFDIDSSAPSQL